MDTEKLDLNEEQNNKNGKKVEATTVAMSALGGAAAGVVGATVFGGDDAHAETGTTNTNQGGEAPTQTEEPAGTTQTEEPTGTTQTGGQAAQNTGQQTSSDQPTPLSPDEPGNTGGQTTTTATSTATTGGTTSNTGTETTLESHPIDPEEAEALAIAEQLVSEDEIDLYDNDAPTLAIVDTDVIYDENGDEIPVALVSIPGEDDPYILADVDGDHVYDYMVDSNGEIVATVEGGLNLDDAEIAVSDDSGYLAANEDSIEVLSDEDITADIMVLDDGGYDMHGEDLEVIPEEEMAYTGDEEYETILDDSDPIDDIISDITYEAPDEV